MKTHLFYIVFLILGGLSACNGDGNSNNADLINNPSTATDPNAKGNEPVMTFDSEHFDFGQLTEGDNVEHVYEFTNTGNKPLLISAVEVTCGCTVPKWPREPIKPGEKSSIKLQFNSSNKSEQINKEVTIVSNANPVKKKLTFSAYVNKKPEVK